MEMRPSWFERWSAPARGSCQICGASTGGSPWQAYGVTNDLRRWARRICDACQVSIPWITAIGCRDCGRAVRCTDCVRRPLAAHGLAANRSVVQYDARMKEWLSRYKFKGEIGLAGLLAGMMVERYAELFQHTEMRKRSSQGSRCSERLGNWLGMGRNALYLYPDVITYVPSSEERLAERGFNQAAVIAELLGQAWQKRVINTLLRASGDARQSHQTRSGRELSMRGMYSVDRNAMRHLDRLFPNTDAGGYSMLLVDDVYTTGNTLRACALELKAAFVELDVQVSIYAYCWARA